jgi:hypothetical protein
MVLVDPLQIGPHPATILRRAGTLPTSTERGAASWVHRQHRFKPEVTDSVVDEVIDVAETPPPMEAQRRERYLARIDVSVRAAQLLSHESVSLKSLFFCQLGSFQFISASEAFAKRRSYPLMATE